MIIIGLCGNSGSGKSTISKSFQKFGISSIDADLVYRDLTGADSNLNRLLSYHFGAKILNSDFSLNRKALSEIVFSDKTGDSLRLLNGITHSHIIAETERRISALEKSGAKAVVFDAPLLFESGFNKKCNVIIAATAEKETKIKRIMLRDKIDYSKACARIDSQIPEHILEERADYVICTNDGADIDAQIQEIIKNII